MVYNFFDKKSATHTGTRINSNLPAINRRITKVNSFFKDNIWGAGPA